MTERKKIILMHRQLAREYPKLSKEWKEVNARMNEILIEIQKVKEFEQTWEELQTKRMAESPRQKWR